MTGLAVCLSLLGAFGGCAGRNQTTSENPSNQAELAPRTIQLPPFLVDESATLEYDVPVKNETERTLKFASVRQACSCSGTARLGTMELSPGQETTLHFAIDLRQRRGLQHFSATLVEENGVNRTFSLETTVYQRIAFAEAGAVHLGMVNPGEQLAKETYLCAYAKDREALPQSFSVKSESKQLSAEAGSSIDEVLADGVIARKVPIELLLKAPQIPGLASVPVRAEVTWKEQKQEIQTSVDWNVRTLFSVTPAQVYFGQVDPSDTEPVQRRVLLQRSDKLPMMVKAIRSPRPEVRCATEPFATGTITQLVFTLDPRSVTKALWGEILVETDHPIQATITIPVAALSKLEK